MSIEALVFATGLLATFVASVLADEQQQRLRNGTFGALAGSAIGAVASLITKDNTLLIEGAFGSAVGAATGWAVYLILAFIASRDWGKRLVEYHVHGLAGVHAQILADEKMLLIQALNLWGSNFGRAVGIGRDRILAKAHTQDCNYWSRLVIVGWLTTAIDTFNLVLDALASQHKYRSRATVVVFGRTLDGEIVGRHWCSYSGRLAAHRSDPFDTKSFAYSVLSGSLPSPFFTNSELANREAQKRTGGRYYSFVLFRINDHAVLSIDWPEELDEGDPQMRIVRDLFYLEVVPAIIDVLACWQGSLSTEVSLRSLIDGTNDPADQP
jgi:hypothetical protein